MAKSQHALIYRNVPKLLRQMREEAGLTQRDLAVQVNKPQPWVHKSEDGSRRVDVAEFMEWAIACKRDPMKAFGSLISMK